MYVRYPLSLCNVEDPLARRGIDICHETVRLWWNRFGPMFAAEIRKKRVDAMRAHTHWQWHLDEVYVKINGQMHYLWRAVDHEGEVLESFATKERDKKAALSFMKKLMKRHGCAEVITTDGLRSHSAAMKELGIADRQEVGRYANNPAENSPTVPKARTGDAQVPTDEDTTEVQFCPCRLPQPLQPRAPRRQPQRLQGSPICRYGWRPSRLKLESLPYLRRSETCSGWTDSTTRDVQKLVTVGLTAPLSKFVRAFTCLLDRLSQPGNPLDRMRIKKQLRGLIEKHCGALTGFISRPIRKCMGARVA